MEADKRLHRPASGAPIAGVCAAIAERTGIDPLIIRVAAILLAVSSGIGLVLYLAAWLLIPREGHERGPLLETFPALDQVPRWVRITALVVAVLAVAVPVGQVTSTSLFPAVIIGLVYYFGVHQPRNRRAARRAQQSAGPQQFPSPHHQAGAMPPPQSRPFGAPRYAAPPQAGPAPAQFEAGTPTTVRPVPTAPPGPYVPPSYGAGPSPAPQPAPTVTAYASAPVPAPAPGQDPMLSAYLTHPDPIGLYTPTPAKPRAARLPDPQRVGKRTLGLVTLTMLGLLWTGLALAAAAGQTIPMYLWATTALIVVGGALVIGAWVGRPRGLAMAAVVLAIVASAGAYFNNNPVTEPVVAPDAVVYLAPEELPPADAWDIGAPTVDLSGLEIQQDVTYDARLGAGSLTIMVPDSARVVVNGNVSMGSMSIGSFTSDQPTQTTRVVSEGPPDAPTLTINATTEVGELVVVQP